jgi:hypothetical protein
VQHQDPLRNQIVLDLAARAGRIDRWPRGASENCEAVGNSPLSATSLAFASNRPQRSCGSMEKQFRRTPERKKTRRTPRPPPLLSVANGERAQWPITSSSGKSMSSGRQEYALHLHCCSEIRLRWCRLWPLCLLSLRHC